MINLKTIEELRTKEELINYFKQLGKEITEEELNALKQSYEKSEKNNGTLTLEQLDDVAGGWACIIEGGRESEFSEEQVFSFKHATKLGNVQSLSTLPIWAGTMNVAISEYTLVEVKENGDISSINNTPRQESDYYRLLKVLNHDNLAHIYITESEPNSTEGSFKHYNGGKLVLVSRDMIDKNHDLPVYLSTIYDKLNEGSKIDLVEAK